MFFIGAIISLPRFSGTPFLFKLTYYIYTIILFLGADITKWKKEDGYFIAHEISSFAEWICAGCTSAYIFLLHYDFKDIQLSEPIIIINNAISLNINNTSRF